MSFLKPEGGSRGSTGGIPPDTAVEDTAGVATNDDVRELALSLPGTIEKPSYGTPGFRVKDRLFARLREDPDALVIWTDERELLLGAEPDKFFTTPHYDGYPMVLVRVEAVDREELTELLTDSYRLRGGTVPDDG
jgi:hypothetical protein